MPGSLTASVVNVLLTAVARAGADPRRLVGETRLDVAGVPVPGSRVPAEAVTELWNRAARAVGDPDFGMNLGLSYEPGRFALLDFLFLSSGTLSEAFGSVVRHIDLVTTGGSYEMSTSGDLVTLTRRMPAMDENRHPASAALGWQLTLARAAVGAPVRPVSIGMAMPAPPRHRDLAAAYGTKLIEFGQDANTLTFRRRDLDRPLLGADPALAALLRRTVSRLRHGEGRPWRDRVRSFLAAGLDHDRATLRAAAHSLALSPRRLQQLLHEEGTSWRQELEAERARLAVELLSGTGMPVAAISARLGYADVRAFRRAFRRVHGRTPQEYRSSIA
ncbi:AraC family transcriptional regulator [Nonomuraea sp. FMUSA5-5]|uniref:AraC family transcriptional regulator n=1 Tax=Nonomuraea composti TaxID=2720023 RepID=A0ABX1BDY8_9ACTN|nr:AraC family transcriptional regulator [Nonomuraea sp. FMUSA5-5]NJP95994.1 AraC family transcriptional regulator [Nonomuraea sp. FMUSA5-5]